MRRDDPQTFEAAPTVDLAVVILDSHTLLLRFASAYLQPTNRWGGCRLDATQQGELVSKDYGLAAVALARFICSGKSP